MFTTHFLSSRQAKELLVRARPIRLALPLPPVEVPDLLDWARSVLPPELRPLVRSAHEAEIRVEPPAGHGSALADVLGAISDRQSAWSIGVAVADVLLAPDRPRGEPLPLQWPAYVLFEGRRFPAARPALAKLAAGFVAIRAACAAMLAAGEIDAEQSRDVEGSLRQVALDLGCPPPGASDGEMRAWAANENAPGR